ncbi:MAG: hypothetical protein ABSG46_01370 [Candidatus Binataceae bacterium]|jgi:hypothetical protein
MLRRYPAVILLLGALSALAGCTQTSSIATTNGGHCQTTTSNYIFYSGFNTQCWDKDGKLISQQGN